VDGIRISELMPSLAKQADKYTLIRSMTHGVNSHETASYTVQTGRPSGGREVFPSVGAASWATGTSHSPPGAIRRRPSSWSKGWWPRGSRTNASTPAGSCCTT
jgi:hypothetical protein